MLPLLHYLLTCMKVEARSGNILCHYFQHRNAREHGRTGSSRAFACRFTRSSLEGKKVTAAHETVLALLKDGCEHESVRVAALEALTNLEEDRGVGRLLEALNDPMEKVRQAASQNLAKRTIPSSPEEPPTNTSLGYASRRLRYQENLERTRLLICFLIFLATKTRQKLYVQQQGGRW